MKELFEQFLGIVIRHSKYQGVVCGYNEEHFILAIESHKPTGFSRLDAKYIAPEYNTSQYKYVYEDEAEILRQINDSHKFLKIYKYGKEERREARVG